MLRNDLVKMKREKFPYKLTLMIEPCIVEILKGYAKEHRLTMSCIVENLIYTNLGGDCNESNGN